MDMVEISTPELLTITTCVLMTLGMLPPDSSQWADCDEVRTKLIHELALRGMLGEL
jgi:hypothetical protein